MTLEIMPYSTINQVVNDYQSAVELIKTGYQNLSTAQSRLKSICQHPSVLPENRSIYDLQDTISRVLNKAKADAWAGLLQKTQAPKFMTESRHNEFMRDLGNPAKLPEITIETVQDFINNLIASAPKMLLDFIKETFDWLQPKGWRSDKYKTNEKSKYEIQEKLIMTWMFEPRDKWGYGPKLSYRSEQSLRSMDAAFHLMDGKGIPKNGNAAYSAIRIAEQEKRLDAETDYFKFKWYNNGNCHIVFKRLDLVQRMNQIAGENLLKPN